MRDVFENIKDFVLDHYPVVIGGACMVILGIVLMTGDSTISDLENQLPALRTEIEETKVALNASTDVDVDGEVEVIKEATINARAIGETIVKAQQEAADYYSSPGSSSDAVRNTGVKAMEVIDKHIAGDPMSNLWSHNNSWTLELKTIVNYRDAAEMPVIFTMTNSSDELMGLVRAVYVVESDSLDKVNVQYTAAGRADFVEIGLD